MTADRLAYWFTRSRTFAVVDDLRSRLTAAVGQSRTVSAAAAGLDEWRRRDWPLRYLNIGGVLVAAAATNALMLWISGGVIGWMILIIPALAAVIGGLAITLALLKKDRLPE